MEPTAAAVSQDPPQSVGENPPPPLAVKREEKKDAEKIAAKPPQPTTSADETKKKNEQDPKLVSKEPTEKQKSAAPKKEVPREAASASPGKRMDDFVTIDDDEENFAPGGRKRAVTLTGEAQEQQKSAAQHLHTVFLWFSLPFSLGCAILAIVLYSMHKVHADTVSHYISGLCAFASLVLTIFLIYGHLTSYTNPELQRYIIRILLLCPIYAIDSFVALVAFRYATVVNLVRDTYEAYVIYMFFKLMVGYLGGEEEVVRLWKQHCPTMNHPPPLCCLSPVNLNQKTLNVWKFCLLQYMIINPILTVIAIPLYFTGYYNEAKFSDPLDAFPYFVAIRFISVTFAFTSLVYFYIGSKTLLKEHKPLGKFASIKIVVFLSFWQTVLLGALNHFEVIPKSESGTWSSSEVATGLGNFVLCVEMYLISFAHRWIFEDTPYVPLAGRTSVQGWALCHAFSVKDVIADTALTVQLITPADNPQRHAAGVEQEDSLHQMDYGST